MGLRDKEVKEILADSANGTGMAAVIWRLQNGRNLFGQRECRVD